MASQTLHGRKVAILLAPAGSEQVEFTEPKKAVEEAGADVDVIGAQARQARTYNHRPRSRRDLHRGQDLRPGLCRRLRRAARARRHCGRGQAPR